MANIKLVLEIVVLKVVVLEVASISTVSEVQK